MQASSRTARDAHTFVHLDAAAFAFGDLDADAEGVAGTEIGNGAQFGQRGDLLGFERLDKVHSIRP